MPPLTRWQHAWRLGTVWLIGGLFWLFVFGLSPAGDGDLDRTQLVDVLLLVDLVVGQLVVVLVAFRRRSPLLVAVLAVLLSAVSAWAAPASALAMMSLATRRRLGPILVILALNLAISLVYEFMVAPHIFPEDPAYRDGGSWWQTLINVVIVVLVMAILTLIGWNIGGRRLLVASWRSQAETAQREQAARVAQARLAERARIAREMHDVMGHRLSLVAMHAGALTHRPDLTDEQRAQSAEIVRSGAHQALEELRVVLGVLRGDDVGEQVESATPRAVEAPQPTLTDIPSLVAEVTSSGQSVTLDADPALWERSVDLAESVGRHAYRVVQESLTNARKHAPGAEVRVDLFGDEQEGLSVVVRNPTAPGPSPMAGAGLGLPGMSERVHLAGGTFEAGVVGGEFAVRVWLPWSTT